MSENTGVDKAEKDARMWGMLCHLSALAFFFLPSLGQIIGPLVVWLIKKDEIPLVDREGKKSLNFQITVSIAALVLTPFILLVIGIPLLFLLGVFALVFTIIAAVKTSNGESFEYPLSIKFFK